MKKTKSILWRKALLIMLSMFFPASIFALDLAESNVVLNEKTKDYSISVLRSSSEELTVQFTLDNVDFRPDLELSGRYYAEIGGFIQNHNAGHPSLPVRTISFELPIAQNCDVQGIDSLFQYYDYELTPSRPLRTTNDTSSDVPAITAYAGFLNHGVFNIEGYQTYRYIHTHYFSVCPVNYDYQHKKVRVCKSFTAKIRYNESDIDNTFSIKNHSFRTSTAYRKQIVGESELVPELKDVTEDYLILSMAWIDSVDIKRFAEWKRTQGYRTHIEYRNRWTCSEVDEVVKSYYNNPDLNLNYLLILGTQDEIPGVLMPKSTIIPNTTQAFYDLPYACMDGPNDMIADIYYGRIGVYTKDMIKTVVDKWIKYQKDPIMDESFYKNAFVSGMFHPQNSEGKIYEDTDITRENELLKLVLNRIGKNARRIYTINNNEEDLSNIVSPTHFGRWARAVKVGSDTIIYPELLELPEDLKKTNYLWDGNEAKIVNAINDGCFLGAYYGHGNAYGWPSLGYTIYNNSMNRQTNGPKQPLILSVACSTGDLKMRSSFAYELSRRENGSIGVIAGSNTTFQPDNTYFYEGMIDFIFDNPGLQSDTIPMTKHPYNIIQLGGILKSGISRMVKFERLSDVKETIYAYHVFGDPSSQFFTEVPMEFTTPNITYDGSSIKVNLNFEETPAFVSFYDHGSGKIERYLYYLDKASFIPESDSITTICILGKNKKPYLMEFDPKNYVLDANINPDIRIIRSATFDKATSTIKVKLNLNCSPEILNEICDNRLTLTVNKFGEMLLKNLSIDHNTHTAEVQLYNPTSGIYVISAKNKSGKLLDSYKLQITVD